MKILICDYIVCDRPFSYMGQEYPSLWVSEIFLSLPTSLSHPRIKLLSQTAHCYMSRLMTKPTKWHVHPAKTQISLDIRPVWSRSLLSTWRKLWSLASSYPLNAQRRLWSDRRMPRLIWVLAGRTAILLVLSWGSSYIDAQEQLLQHMFLGCNCIYKHFVETKNNVLRFLEHLLYSVFGHKTTVQEFEQNQCHDIIRSSEMNMLFNR